MFGRRGCSRRGAMLELLLSSLASVVCGGAMASRFMKRRLVDHPQEWFFSALAYGRRDLAVKGDPDINWNESHPSFGTPLHAIGGKGIQFEVEGHPTFDWSPESKACIKDLLALFEFALERGADPTAICPQACPVCIRFRVLTAGGASLYDLKESIAGKSAISLWLSFSQQANEVDNSRQEQLPLASSFFDSILSLLLQEVPKYRGVYSKKQPCRLAAAPAMVEVPEATTGLWRRVMEREETCDVLFRCEGGDVHVHSWVVASSSQVLAAMLRWPRGDGAPSPTLTLGDRREVVAAWRELAYTGLPPAAEMSLELLLSVLDLSHRWQDHLLDCGLLTAALAKRVVDAESCRLVLQAAIAKQLPDLRGDCLAFARRCKELRREWERGDFQEEEELSKQLGSLFGVTCRPGGGGGAHAGVGARRQWDW